MKFFNSALVHIILAASTVAALEKAIVDDTKEAKSLRGKNKGIDKRRGLKGGKGDDPSPWQPAPDPWHPAPDPWQPAPDPWHPEPDPWGPSDDYVEPDPWNPDPWYSGDGDDYVEPDPWNPDPWHPEPDPWNPDPWHPEPDPWAPEPDPWAPEPDPWAPKPMPPKRPKIQKWLKQKAAKGAKGKGSKSSKGKDHDPWNPDPWSPDHDPWYPDHDPVPPHYHPEQCKYFKIKLGALQAPSQDTVGTAADLGAEFIYNSPLFEDEDLTDPVGDDPNNPDAFVTGVCTRFQQSQDLGNGDVIAGAGQCDWTYTINIEGLEGTVQVSGEVFDSVKSTLSITGGTNVFVGAAGQMEMIPSPEGTNIDIFTEVNYYNISAVVYIKECDPTHWTWWKNHRGNWDWNGYAPKGGGYGHGHGHGY